MTRLWTKKTCPPRRISRSTASRIVPSAKGRTKVRMERRSSGGVAMRLTSRMPEKAMCRVRGIGVADRVSTSTAARIFFSRSLCATPKRCSSSITTSPRSANFTSLCSSRCVPMTMSNAPFASPFSTSACSFLERKRERFATRTGSPRGAA